MKIIIFDTFGNTKFVLTEKNKIDKYVNIKKLLLTLYHIDNGKPINEKIKLMDECLENWNLKTFISLFNENMKEFNYDYRACLILE